MICADIKQVKTTNLQGAAKRKMIQVSLLRDNARPQTDLCTRVAVAVVGWTVLPCLPYSLNLSSPFSISLAH